MGIEEIAVFTAANQLAQAIGSYLVRTQSVPTNAYAKAAIAVGIQLCSAVTKATAWGIAAANAEFVTTQIQEKAAAAQLQTLPPIT